MLTVSWRKIIEEHMIAVGIDINCPIAVLRCYTAVQYLLSVKLPDKWGVSDVAQSLQEPACKALLQYYGAAEDHDKFCTHYEDFAALCTSIRESGAEKDHYHFFDTFAPNIVMDWGWLESSFSGRKLDMLFMICVLLSMFQNNWRTMNTAPEHIFESFKKNEEVFTRLHADFEKYLGSWEAINYVLLSFLNPKESVAIKDAKKVYKSNKVPYSKLLTDYYEARTYFTQLKKKTNRWETIQEIKGRVKIERGVTTDEQLFNEAAYRISKELPTTVVHSLFYMNRDDSMIETGFMIKELYDAARNADDILVVNPSPAFLLAYKSSRLFHRHVMCVVPDQIVAELYASQFHDYSFVTSSSLDAEKRYDCVLVFVRDSNYEDMESYFIQTKDHGRLIALAPQTYLSDKKAKFARMLEDNEIHINKIVEVPKEAVQSTRIKKMVVYATRGKAYKDAYFWLLAAKLSQDMLFLDNNVSRIPAPWLKSGLTLQKMRRKIAEQSRETKHLEEPRVYHFSPDIELRYVMIKRADAYSAKADYRGILREHQKHRKFGVMLTPKTEKGLRASSEEEVVSRLEMVPFYEEFTQAIVDDLYDYYECCPYKLSLKSIWFCCRITLREKDFYDDYLAKEMFCGENQTLSNIVPAEAAEEAYINAMNQVFAEKEGAYRKYWDQLVLILNEAVSAGFVSTNPLKTRNDVIPGDFRLGVRKLRAALGKNWLDVDQEAKMINFLYESVDEEGTPRFVHDSTYLSVAIRLFTGMPTREVCALTWDDFTRVGWTGCFQFIVMKHLDSRNQLISHVNYHNEKTRRKVPCSPLLATMLHKRKQYLQQKWSVQNETLKMMPIVLPREYATVKQSGKSTFCSREKVNAVCKEVLAKANIPSNVIQLLGGDENYSVDLNGYGGDIYYANFRHKIIQHCGFSDGERAYVTGTKAATTFAEHYLDYGNVFSQLRMVHRLKRWVCQIEAIGMKPPKARCKSRAFTGRLYEEIQGVAGGKTCVEIDLEPMQEMLGETEVEIEVSNGAEVKVTVFLKEDE